MFPDYRITIAGLDVTPRMRGYVLELTVVDNSGKTNDTFSVNLDDRDGILKLPKRGEEVVVEMGYRGNLRRMGSFKIDEVELSGIPRRMKVTGTAADVYKAQGKGQRTEHYQNKSLQEVMQQVAGRNGWQAAIHSSFSAMRYPMLHQTDESDLHFIRRMEREVGAVAKIAEGRLTFVPSGQGISASGGAMPTVVLRYTDLLSWRVSHKGRPKHGKVKAAHGNRHTSQREETTATNDQDADGATFYLRNIFPNRDRAQVAAEARLRELRRSEKSASFQITGNPNIKAEGQLTIVGVRDGVDETYLVKTVTHTIAGTGGGYTTTIEADNKPAASAGASRAARPAAGATPTPTPAPTPAPAAEEHGDGEGSE
ncbi:phage late control D family protein [Phreatobacter sp. HK31-P]